MLRLRVSACLVLVVSAVSCGGGSFTSASAAGDNDASAGAGGSAGVGGSGGGLDASSDVPSETAGSGGGIDAGGAGGIDAGGAAGAGGSPVTTCPPDLPALNTPCTTGLLCSYGDHPRPDCHVQLACNGDTFTQSGGMSCPQPVACLDLPSVPVIGKACSVADQDCFSSGNVYCRCVPCPDTGCTGMAWECVGPPLTPCPTSLPNMGQPCTNTGLTCTYGNCTTLTKVQVDCSFGVWHWTVPDCSGR